MAALLETPKGWPAVLLGRAGKYDPEAGLAQAEKAGAWKAWRDALKQGPEALLRVVDDSGLRGRGGAGYPTAAKWRAVRAQPGVTRYAVGNGYEADPGAQGVRTLLELDPLAVLEGLALAAFTVGAREALLAVRADAVDALRRLRLGIAEAETAGYLGHDILGSGVDLQLEVREVEGAFVLGEETVLLRALEGKRGMPEQRPPYPSERGLWGEPTAVNSALTLAALPWIVAHGAKAFRGIGAADFPGTLLVQLSGAVKRPGLAEVPTGTRIGEVLEKVGGTEPGRLKAVLVGGPSGGFLPPTELTTALTPNALEAAGAILGSGSLVALDGSACVVELATLMERFMNDESCGKCIPCRIGTRRLAEIGERYMGGRSRPDDPLLLVDLAADVRDGSLCGHGITAPNPLTSAMRYFGPEFQEHALRGRCPAGVCSPLRVAAGGAR
jgi:NADH:ubiquinone oxidoreductase subunit F (NADH-binding)